MSSNLAGLFVRLQRGSNSYAACYAPVATPLNTNKNPAQIRTIISFQLPNPASSCLKTVESDIL